MPIYLYTNMINKFGFYNQNQEQSPPPPPPSPPVQNANHEEIAMQLSKKQTFMRPQDYHPFHIPPNIELAKLHCRATQFGSLSTSTLFQRNQNEFVCNCCGQQQKELLAICCPPNRIYRVNQAQGYYFTYIKIIILAVILILLISGLYTFITTIEYCKEPSRCLVVYSIPLPQNVKFFTMTNTILNIIAAFIIYPFAIYLFYSKAIIHEKMKKSIMRISDYSILISGIDYTRITDEQLIQALQTYEVQSILFTHKIGRYLPSMEQKFILQAKKNLYFKQGLTQKQKQIEKQIHQINNIVLPFKNSINIGKQRDLRTDKIIVKFKTVQQRQQFLQKYHVNLCNREIDVILGRSPLQINDMPLYVEYPGQPEQMIWQNLQVSSNYKFFIVILNTFINVIILAASFALIVLLTHLRNEQSQSNQLFTSFMVALLVQLINFISYLAVYKLTQMQKRITLTGQIIARIIRNVLMFFFNTTLIPFSLFVLDWLNTDKLFVYEYIISLFVINNLITPFSPIYNPFNFYKIYCRRKIIKQGKDCLFTQLQTNQIFQKIDFQLELRYELLSQRIMNCCFYASIFPEVIFLTIIGLAIDYWIEKWWLLKHCCIPKYSYRLGDIINRITIFFPPVYLFGYMANLLMLQNDFEINQMQYIIILCFLVLSLIFSILIYAFIKGFIDSYIDKHESLISDQSSVTVRPLDYTDLNPTSFLHIDLKNRVNVQLNQSKPKKLQNFQKIEEFVFKRKKQALTRRQSQGLQRVNMMRQSKVKDEKDK